jgi:hypothetical protein
MQRFISKTIRLAFPITLLCFSTLGRLQADDKEGTANTPPVTAGAELSAENTASQENNASQESSVVPKAASPEATTWDSIQVFPPKISLSTQSDLQHVIAVASRSDGITQDVTQLADWKLTDESFVNLENHVVRPKTDGSTELIATWNGLNAKSIIDVTKSQESRPVSFGHDIMPILTRSGCNTGSCHGAARGKDGFRLSLFGFDPNGDHFRITREIGIRRVNLARPEESLILLKATGAVPHSGGKKIEPDSQHYKTMLAWLSSGAPNDPAPPAAVTAVDIFPEQAVLEGDAATQQLVTVAHYADGTTRDIYDLAAFATNNERTAAIEPSGEITSGVRGEAFVMARFDTHTVGSQVLALPANLNFSQSPVTGNYIDELVGNKLTKLRLDTSPICTDAEFLRRVTIDICGQLPTEEEFNTFANDQSSDKRSQKINELLERKAFSEIWAMKWAQLLMIKSNNQVSYKAAFLYNQWLTNKIASNEPIDQIVREMLSADGGVFKTPATNFYQIETDTLKTAENVSQVFMGIRTQCAQCHNHPFDRWTMDDYYGFASFFSQIGRKQAEDYRETIVFNRRGGEVNHPVKGKPEPPKFLGGVVPDTKGQDRRQVLADWITSNENPFFATSVANRIWAHFMGVGIVDPVDDFRVSNPASNPQLLKELSSRLTEYKFDFKQIVRDICNSNAYQRSSQTTELNAQDQRNYSHALVRRIPAENLLDCISQVTSTKDKFRGLPLGARAVQIADGSTSNYFLNTFGRSQRTTVCEGEASTDPSLSQALHLINGSSAQGKISQGKLISTWLEQSASPTEIVEKIYVRALGRKPTEAESATLLKLVADAGNAQQGLEDVFWAVLNSREFIFNH